MESRGAEQVIISATEKKTEAVIRFTQADRRPPIVNLMSPHLKRGSGQFYVDTGADVTLVKRKSARENISVNSEHIIIINGVPGKMTA